MRFGMRNSLALAGVAAVATVPLLGATSGSASRNVTVTCGETLTASVTLTNNLSCGSGDGLVAGKSAIAINLDGHTISGIGSGATGIATTGFSNVTVENGVIESFTTGVSGDGNGDRIVTLQLLNMGGNGIALTGATGDIVTGNFVDNSAGIGIDLAGSSTNATVENNYVEFSGDDGIDLPNATGVTVSGNKAVSNHGSVGIEVTGGTGRVTGNVANGNTTGGIEADGIPSPGRALTVSGNRASFNGALGIVASVELDGGSNTVQSNGSAAECSGIVCTEVSG